MAFAWPSFMTAQTLSFGIQKAGVQFRSPMAGSVESVEFPGQFWRASITTAPRKLIHGPAAEAFLSRIAGGAERVLVPYWPRLVPRGTLRGSPTVNTATARGDLVLLVNTPGATDTLRAGDVIGAGSQVFQVFQDCAAVAGVLTVPLVNRARGVIAASTPVVWNAPPVTMLVPSFVSMANYRPGSQDGIAVDLEEAF